MLTINTNLSSLIAQGSMKSSTNKLNQAIERMTTGFKINHAKDNAANYSISTNMTTKIGAYDVAEDNAAMGLDLISVLSSTLELIDNHVSRIRDLCMQASNGALGEDSHKAIQTEIDSRLQEIDRIKANAEYNGIKLCESITEEVSYFLKPVTKLSEEEAVTQGYIIIKSADELQNIENNLSGKYILLNDINLSGYNWTPISEFTGELNGNGFEITNLEINSSSDNIGFFENLAGGTVKDLAITKAHIIGNENVGILGGNSDSYNQSTISNVYLEGSVSGTANIGGMFGYNSHGVSNGGIYDSIINVIVSGNNCDYGTICGFTIDHSLTSYNTFTATDIANGLLQIQPSQVGDKLEISLQIGINSNSNSQLKIILESLESLAAINATTSNNARNSITTLDDFLLNIRNKQTELGAVQNRLESVLDEITIKRDNLISSRSTIRDADIAEVSSHYIQQQILQQASATLLATANQSPAIALQLI